MRQFVGRGPGTGGADVIIMESVVLLIVAVPIYVVWRTVSWRTQGGDWLRELGVTACFLYALGVGSVTFFPLTVIYYDWHEMYNFVPFASITDMIRYSLPEVAVRNILGNVVLFVPLGVILPVLFPRARRLGALLWRAAAVSVAIEVLQALTRTRSTDVDDVILNVTGALLGYGAFALLTMAAVRVGWLGRLFERLGSKSEREPLLAAVVPISATILVIIALMGYAVAAGTLGENQIGADLTATMPGSSVVASERSGNYVFLVAASKGTSSEEFVCAEYLEAFSGRFVKRAYSDGPDKTSGSCYSLTVTESNPTEGVRPIVYAVGRNEASATTLAVHTKGATADTPENRQVLRRGAPDAGRSEHRQLPRPLPRRLRQRRHCELQDRPVILRVRSPRFQL